jgi:hypothetical protein
MAKRVWFVSVVVVALSLSSISSAGMLDWLYGIYPQQNTCASQQQSSCINMTQMTTKAGPGTAYSTNSVPNASSTQALSTKGTTMIQGTDFTGCQTSIISGGCGSCGATYQNISVQTNQSQSVR